MQVFDFLRGFFGKKRRSDFEPNDHSPEERRFFETVEMTKIADPDPSPYFKTIAGLLLQLQNKQLAGFAVFTDAGDEDLVAGAVPAWGGILPQVSGLPVADAESICPKMCPIFSAVDCVEIGLPAAILVAVDEQFSIRRKRDVSLCVRKNLRSAECAGDELLIRVEQDLSIAQSANHPVPVVPLRVPADMDSVGAKVLTLVGRNEGVVDSSPPLPAPACSREKENPISLAV